MGFFFSRFSQQSAEIIAYATLKINNSAKQGDNLEMKSSLSLSNDFVTMFLSFHA